MLYGEWLYIGTDVIYYQYDRDKHFILENTKYDYTKAIHLTFDFNIAKGKPMSSASFQYDKNKNFFNSIKTISLGKKN